VGIRPGFGRGETRLGLPEKGRRPWIWGSRLLRKYISVCHCDLMVLHINHSSLLSVLCRSQVLWASPLQPAELSSALAPLPSSHTMPTIANATRVWEINVHWPMYSQCGVWDPRGRGVDIWECIRDRKYVLSSVHDNSSSPFILDDSTPGTEVSRFSSPRLSRQHIYFFAQPPNTKYWRYIARR
jgi:hypothetical protein